LSDPLRLRDFRSADAPQANRLALAAFDQFKNYYSDWAAIVRERRLHDNARRAR
jgi:hypothetical protein